MLAQVSPATVRLIVDRWGPIDFTNPFYTSQDYVKASRTNIYPNLVERAKARIRWEKAQDLENMMALDSKISEADWDTLYNIGVQLCQEIQQYASEDQLVRWRDLVARIWKGARRGEMLSANFPWEEMNAWYLKSWDLDYRRFDATALVVAIQKDLSTP